MVVFHTIADRVGCVVLLGTQGPSAPQRQISLFCESVSVASVHILSRSFVASGWKMSRKELRRDTDYFLVGHPEHAISGSKLPTVRSVLKFFFHVRKDLDNSTALRAVVDNVICFWTMARIPTMLPRNCTRKLKMLYEEWHALAKHKDRESDPGGRRAKFEDSLDKLWDIGATDAIKQILGSRMLKQQEREIDVKFYLDQRSERKGYMSGNDKVFAQTVLRCEQRQREEQRRFQESSAQGPSETAILSSSSSTDSRGSPLMSIKSSIQARRRELG